MSILHVDLSDSEQEEIEINDFGQLQNLLVNLSYCR